MREQKANNQPPKVLVAAQLEKENGRETRFKESKNKKELLERLSFATISTKVLEDLAFHWSFQLQQESIVWM